MVSGRGAFVESFDPLAKAKFAVCCELDDRTGDAKLFSGCPIEESEIIELFGDSIRTEVSCSWDRAQERVKSVSRRMLGSMTIGESALSGKELESHGDEVISAMVDGIRQKGVENLPCWTKDSMQLRARIAFVHRWFAAENWPEPTDEAILSAIRGFLSGCTMWRDLEKIDLREVLGTILAESGHSRRELDRLAPMKMEVPSGSQMTISYEGQEPMVSVRLQECFGMTDTPRIANGKVPVVMTLLSPAHRPIQVTKDLAGFWRGAYQLVRKEMRGRYPRHYWPEDPLTAIATRRTRPQKI